MAVSNLPIRRLVAVPLSALLIIIVSWLSGIEDVVRKLAGFPPQAVASMLVLLWANLFLVSFRFWRILAHFGVALPWEIALRANIAGTVAGLFVIPLFSQIMGRQMVLQSLGVTSVVNASLAAYERVLLALVCGVLGALGGIYLLGQTTIARFFEQIALAEIVIAACGGLALSLWLGRSRFEKKLSGRVLSRANLARVMVIVGLTFVGQFLMLGCFVVGILAVSQGIPIVSLFAASAIISLAASVPITVNGWGVREGAAVYVLGGLGIPAADALTISVMVGLCSTLVILASAPFCFRKLSMSELAKPSVVVVHSVSEIEKFAAWGLSMVVAVMVFFQAHVSLPGGLINLNLADAFAILALAAVSLHMLYARQTPVWRIGQFNAVLGVISLLLLLGFMHGWLEIGITQWALGARLLGWLVLLGYLSAGYVIVANVGPHGLRRFAETLIATAVVVVMLQVILRLLAYWGVNLGAHFTPNFEGYAGNRNAFAFQLLAVMALLLGYSHAYARYSISLQRPGRLWVFSLLLGILLAGLIWTGSRMGMLVGGMVLLLVGLGRLADRRMLGRGVIFGILLWCSVWLVAPKTLTSGNIPVQSNLSDETSDLERWDTLTLGLEMWRQSPLLGAGLGVFHAKSPTWMGHPQVIHSTPLWVVAEFGLLGGVVFGWAFFLLARHAIRFGRTQPAGRILFLLLVTFGVFSLAHEYFISASSGSY
jgi:uncharacterized membrane protein YbhN (UPF0104 family)